jgi:hypothetical protein
MFPWGYTQGYKGDTRQKPKDSHGKKPFLVKVIKSIV